MPSNNARFIFKNLARLTGVAASTVAAGYPAANLLNSDKALTFRAPGKTVMLSGSSPQPLVASGLGMGPCNLSSGATGRLLLYSDAAATDVVLDTDAQYICPAPPVDLEGWNLAQASSAYAHGGGTTAALWFQETTFRAWRLYLDDVNNMQGYIEACHLILGKYFSPARDVDAGVGIKLRDTDVQKRSAAGSLRARAGVKWRELALDLSDMPIADLRVMLRALRSLGRGRPLFAAIYPEDDDTLLDGETRMIGMLSEESEFTLGGPDDFATKITVTQL